MSPITAEQVWRALDQVVDPEIPVVSLVEMGIIRDVRVTDGRIIVTMTPTFSGCPALVVMRQAIVERLYELGAAAVEVQTTLAPAWSSDWITEEGRRKLKAFGLAPPLRHAGQVTLTFFEPVTCPRCDSPHTSLTNSFGSTLCRAIYYCHDCRDAFELFKAL